MAVDEGHQTFRHSAYGAIAGVASFPGVDLAFTTVDEVMTWGLRNSIFVFPLATSCCGIEFMATACGRFDLDRMGTIARGSPRHCDVMIIAGTISVKMAPRVKKLWDQMPEPKWAIAMGSCAISGDFYRNLYSVVPGVDTFMQVDVYVPGCPPNPDHLLEGVRRLQEKIRLKRAGEFVEPDKRPPAGLRAPSVPRIGDPARDPAYDAAQLMAVQQLDPVGAMRRAHAQDLPRPAVLKDAAPSGEDS